MTRPKEFDPEAALKTAAKVFWCLGYVRTSLDMLIRGDGFFQAEPL
jgi:hypothetical protein